MTFNKRITANTFQRNRKQERNGTNSYRVACPNQQRKLNRVRKQVPFTNFRLGSHRLQQPMVSTKWNQQNPPNYSMTGYCGCS